MEITDEYNACHEKNISSIIYPGHSKPPLGPFVVVEPGVVVDGDVVVSVGVTVVDETVVFVVTEPAFYKQKLINSFKYNFLMGAFNCQLFYWRKERIALGRKHFCRCRIPMHLDIFFQSPILRRRRNKQPNKHLECRKIQHFLHTSSL